MRVREIFFHNFRSFRGERRISFVDPLTDTIRPVSVLAGSNGSGKTTVLDAIEALLGFVQQPYNAIPDFVAKAEETGLICIALELTPADLFESDIQQASQSDSPVQILHVAAGRQELLPQDLEEVWPNLLGSFLAHGKHYIHTDGNGEELQKKLSLAIKSMIRGTTDLHGGLLYFPHNRQLNRGRGPIQPPPEEREWNFHFLPLDSWAGSLQQLWVWQNYLDLEQGTKGRENLKPFVESVEDILGKNRRITIKEGRVTVPVSWAGNGKITRVDLDQLPSGEQQILLLFGELARRRRKGAVIAIDEIENSLHPTLQRLVMWNLRKLAREWDAQVIVTTHSLEVINTVRGGAFINLDYPENRFNLPLLNNEDEAQVA